VAVVSEETVRALHTWSIPDSLRGPDGNHVVDWRFAAAWLRRRYDDLFELAGKPVPWCGPYETIGLYPMRLWDIAAKLARLESDRQPIADYLQQAADLVDGLAERDLASLTEFDGQLWRPDTLPSEADRTAHLLKLARVRLDRTTSICGVAVHDAFSWRVDDGGGFSAVHKYQTEKVHTWRHKSLKIRTKRAHGRGSKRELATLCVIDKDTNRKIWCVESWYWIRPTGVFAEAVICDELRPKEPRSPRFLTARELTSGDLRWEIKIRSQPMRGPSDRWYVSEDVLVDAASGEGRRVPRFWSPWKQISDADFIWIKSTYSDASGAVGVGGADGPAVQKAIGGHLREMTPLQLAGRPCAFVVAVDYTSKRTALSWFLWPSLERIDRIDIRGDVGSCDLYTDGVRIHLSVGRDSTTVDLRHPEVAQIDQP
jgi:hypothetical protein